MGHGNQMVGKYNQNTGHKNVINGDSNSNAGNYNNINGSGNRIRLKSTRSRFL